MQQWSLDMLGNWSGSKTDGPDGQSGTADDGTAGEFAGVILYAGYLYDDETGLFHVRNRTYHPTLGRWLQRLGSGTCRDEAGFVQSPRGCER